MRPVSKVVELRQPSFSGKFPKLTPPQKPENADVRSREHLTPGEMDKLLSTTGKLGWHGRRDKTLILLTYCHGLWI